MGLAVEQVYEGLGDSSAPSVAHARDPNAERMLLERGFHDVQPDSMCVTASAPSFAQMEPDLDDEGMDSGVFTSGIDGLVVEDSLVLTCLDSLYQVLPLPILLHVGLHAPLHVALMGRMESHTAEHTRGRRGVLGTGVGRLMAARQVLPPCPLALDAGEPRHCCRGECGRRIGPRAPSGRGSLCQRRGRRLARARD